MEYKIRAFIFYETKTYLHFVCIMKVFPLQHSHLFHKCELIMNITYDYDNEHRTEWHLYWSIVPLNSQIQQV